MSARLVVPCKRSTDGAELVYYRQYEGSPGNLAYIPGSWRHQKQQQKASMHDFGWRRNSADLSHRHIISH